MPVVAFAVPIQPGKTDQMRQFAREAYGPRLEEFRWLIEELRVSLFAQELRTPFPVSAKRLQKFWDEHLR